MTHMKLRETRRGSRVRPKKLCGKEKMRQKLQHEGDIVKVAQMDCTLTACATLVVDREETMAKEPLSSRQDPVSFRNGRRGINHRI
jgi:hypothetical protein